MGYQKKSRKSLNTTSIPQGKINGQRIIARQNGVIAQRSAQGLNVRRLMPSDLLVTTTDLRRETSTFKSHIVKHF
jgi:hypothetical protein